ncbi:MAG: DNA recombination protein RmuC [Magnetovibrionaceae bacterium]
MSFEGLDPSGTIWSVTFWLPVGLGAFVILAVVALSVGLLARQQARARDDQQFAFKALADRLAALTENQTRQQAEQDGRINQLTQAQEQTRATLNRTLEERLDGVAKRLADGLTQSSQQTGEQLGRLGERLAVIDAAQKNLMDLSQQVVGLQDILSNKQARGAFGEVQLNDLVSTVLPPNAYDFQATLSNGKRADCIIHLPNPPGSIAVDAKFPLEGYLALREATDEAQRIQAIRALGTAVTGHVRDIATKYIVPGETAESALMFIPSEAVYAELHASLPEVVEKSYRARVWIVSPTTLMATLNTVRAVLKDAQMREQAHLIQAQVAAMVEDVTRLDKRTENLKSHWTRVGKDIDEIATSTAKIIKRTEKIEALEVGEPEEESDQLDALAPQARAG